MIMIRGRSAKARGARHAHWDIVAGRNAKAVRFYKGAEQVRPGVILDFDENDRVVGVEFMSISSRATRESLLTMQFQMD